MRRLVALAITGMAAASLSGVGPAGAQDVHSDNIRRLAQTGIVLQQDDPTTKDVNEEVRGQGTDLAFEGDTMVAGSFQGFGIFKLFRSEPYIKQIGLAYCPGGQGDVSVYGDLVFVSVDAPQVRNDGSESNGECDSKEASRTDYLRGTTWEGVRIFDISDPRQPQLVKALEVDCGSHTHTLLPHRDKLYLYIHSYPLVSGIGPPCNYATHKKNFIAEVNLEDPTKTKVVGSLDLSPAPGCHDVSFYPEVGLAAAACLVESQVWDINNPVKPKILSRIHSPFILHHSAAFSWDGKTMLIGDEHAGAAAGTACAPGDPDSPFGAMWFYDISDPTSPKEIGHFGPPRMAVPDSPNGVTRHSCTNHNFNVLPMKNPDKQIVSTSWYAAGLSVIDFSDPSQPKEIAYYMPDYEGENADTWAAYWYNGRIYTNDVNLPRANASLPGTPSPGVGVYAVDGLAKKKVHYFRERLNPQVQLREFR